MGAYQNLKSYGGALNRAGALNRGNTVSFLNSFQALFSCRTCLSNKQDYSRSYSSQYLIYDQSLCITCPVLAFYYLLIWQVHISFLIF